MTGNPINRWLFERDLSPGDVAMAVGVSKEIVVAALEGRAVDERVFAFLQKKGCPGMPSVNCRAHRDYYKGRTQ